MQPYKYEIVHRHTAYFHTKKEAEGWVKAMSVRNPQFFSTDNGCEVRWCTYETNYNTSESRAKKVG